MADDTVTKIFRLRDRMKKASPNDLAELIMMDHTVLHTANGAIYEYNRNCWERISDEAIKTWAMTYDKIEDTTNSRRNEIVSYIKVRTHHEKIEWNAGIADDEIPMANGVLNITTQQLREHNTKDYVDSVIPHDWDASAQEPERWLDALDIYFDQCPDIVERIAALQEYMGYCLLQHAKYKKALALWGEPDSGKSVVASIIRRIVGNDAVSSLSLEQLEDPRKCSPIVGKRVNFMAELSRNHLIGPQFKIFTSGGLDCVQVDPKYLDSFLYRPTVKLIVVTNEMPRVDDDTKATFNRLVLLQFPRSIPEQEQDPEFEEKLSSEIPGIIKWSVEGAKRLTLNRKFTIVQSSNQAVDEYRMSNNDVLAFVAANLIEHKDGWIDKDEFYGRFIDWLGGSRTPSKTAVTRKAKAGGIMIDERRQDHGLRRRGLKGYMFAGDGIPAPIMEPPPF